MRLNVNFRPTFALVFVLVFAPIGLCRAQDSSAPRTGPAANAIVKVDLLPVYSGMSKSGPVVQTLKKGDQVFLDLEFRTTERWCSVRRPLETARLGFVPCQALERMITSTAAAGPTNGDTSSASDATVPARSSGKDVSLPPPAARRMYGYDQIAALAVREGTVDAVKISEFDAAARDGLPLSLWRAASAHYAAGSFELSRNSVNEAVEHFQASLSFSANRPDVQVANLLVLAYIDLVQSQYSDALDYLARARRLEPRSVAVAQLSGWAYYGLNQTDAAIKEWQTAQRIEPSPDVAAALAKAERDKAVESGAREANSGHFNLRYQGSATPQLASEILAVLEDHFRTLESEFHFTPAEPIGVVLYTEQSFRDVIELPAWAGAGNDGRIRVPVQGLTSVSDTLSRELKHELVHSFIQQKTLGRCPGWLNEGLAQWFEGKRSDYDAKALIAAYEKGQYIPLERLEGSWARLPTPIARFAYAWSLAATEFIISNSQMWGVDRLFDRFNVDPNFESALRAGLQTDYANLQRQTVDYLKQTYGQ